MSKKSNAILMLCIWAFLTLAKYYDCFTDNTFSPNIVDWLIMIGGPIIIILECLQIYKASKEKEIKE